MRCKRATALRVSEELLSKLLEADVQVGQLVDNKLAHERQSKEGGTRESGN